MMRAMMVLVVLMSAVAQACASDEKGSSGARGFSNGSPKLPSRAIKQTRSINHRGIDYGEFLMKSVPSAIMSQSHQPGKQFLKAQRQQLRESIVPPRKSIRYILIKKKVDAREADHLCWEHGYEPATLDKPTSFRLAKLLHTGKDGLGKGEAVWFGNFYCKEGQRRIPKTVFLLSLKKPSAHLLAVGDASYLNIRASVICQAPRNNKSKKNGFFKMYDRRSICNKKRDVCLISKVGPECRKLCPLGHDILYGAEYGIGFLGQNSSSSYSD